MYLSNEIEAFVTSILGTHLSLNRPEREERVGQHAVWVGPTFEAAGVIGLTFFFCDLWDCSVLRRTSQFI
jgi:hypothetical protein